MKTTIALVVMAAAVVATSGCDGAQIKQLNDSVAALSADQANLKAKIGDLEKVRAEMDGKLTVLQSDRDQVKKALDECASKDKPATKEPDKGNGVKGSAGNGKGVKSAADNGKPKPADGGKTKPTFKPPKKVK